MEKKSQELQELEECCFDKLIILLSLFVETAKERKGSVNGTRNMIDGYLDCMNTLKMISFSEMRNLKKLLFDYQMLKIEER